MQYAIRHITRFTYDAPITSSLMEVRMCPRTEAQQHGYSFELNIAPHAQVFSYQDFMGNTIHHFDIPSKHEELRLEAHSFVEVREPGPLPEAVSTKTWEALDELRATGKHLEMTLPSAFAQPTKALLTLQEELQVTRRDDPLTVLRDLNAAIYDGFSYSPKSTHVNSPIDDALKSKSGVCQDFAHIFITLARSVGIPCRYVSGYLFHRKNGHDQHDRSAEDGSHAWAEAYLPTLGWIGFDPTNNILAEERHIRVAIGRDYADVPPTRGVYQGHARSVLHVGVHVSQASFPLRDEVMPELALVVQSDDADVDLGAMMQAQQ